jgi:hypothetical protein
MNPTNLKNLFDYCDGELYWKSKPSKYANIKIGDKAGRVHSTGYRILQLNGVKQKLHRVIFLMHHGYLPAYIDHIDGNPLNNKVENLRPTTRSQNLCNTKLFINSKSGIKGVSWHTQSKKWYVQVRLKGKSVCQKLIDNLELAELVAIEARDKYHKEFARHT